MASLAGQPIFVVDGKGAVCRSVDEPLEQSGAEVTHFTSATKCLTQLTSQRCNLLITDLRIPDMDGIELVENVKRLAPWIPVVIVTSHGDVPTAVKAIKAGAADFIEKPLDKESFVGKVESILQEGGKNNLLDRPLTHREKTVLRLIVEGRRTREIATLLNRSEKTVEVHRSRIMSKLGVHNLVSLVKQAAAMGLIE